VRGASSIEYDPPLDLSDGSIFFLCTSRTKDAYEETIKAMRGTLAQA